jgi:hypothetical protein
LRKKAREEKKHW